MKRPFDKTNKNDVWHDNIDVMDTINYTNRYRFYNAISEMLDQKINLAAEIKRRGGTQMPVIHINLGCPDTKEYTSQSERFFKLLNLARHYGIIIETNVVEPICLNSWAGWLIKHIATPGFRNLYDTGYHYYYPASYNIQKKRTEIITDNPIIISPDHALKHNICDTVFLSNGLIKTR